MGLLIVVTVGEEVRDSGGVIVVKLGFVGFILGFILGFLVLLGRCFCSPGPGPGPGSSSSSPLFNLVEFFSEFFTFRFGFFGRLQNNNEYLH